MTSQVLRKWSYCVATRPIADRARRQGDGREAWLGPNTRQAMLVLKVLPPPHLLNRFLVLLRIHRFATHTLLGYNVRVVLLFTVTRR